MALVPAPHHALTALLTGRRVAVLTGAGCSTESGIPDYRGPETARRARNPAEYRELMSTPQGRRRYWARSAIGFARLSRAAPNPAHLALAALERAGAVTGVVTQNVDGLHRRAGSQRVVALHGSIHRVRCTLCATTSSRTELQTRLRALNPGWSALDAATAPDGDAVVEAPDGFVTPPCTRCGADALRPDVVLFGESVARPVVAAAWEIVHAADALLVVGSSLTVYSGLRFVRGAAQRQMPVAIVNRGPTRGDPLATLHVDDNAGAVLPALCADLLRSHAR
jgi:NAD-dependent deacetylase sirtuin 4